MLTIEELNDWGYCGPDGLNYAEAAAKLYVPEPSPRAASRFYRFARIERSRFSNRFVRLYFYQGARVYFFADRRNPFRD